jgi:sugar lactone lactonase YvrE
METHHTSALRAASRGWLASLAAAATLLIHTPVDAQVMETIAGPVQSVRSFDGDGYAATATKLGNVTGISFDGKGNLYFVESGDNRIRRIDSSTGLVEHVAGNGDRGPSLVLLGSILNGDGGAATNASLTDPVGIATDPFGNVYFTDLGSHRVRKVEVSTGQISTVAGTTKGYGGDGGPATDALLDQPSGVAIDAVGNIYITDTNNNRIRMVEWASGIMTTIVGTGEPGYSDADGTARNAQLRGPAGIWLDDPWLYFTEKVNHVVRRVHLPSGLIFKVAGRDPSGSPTGSYSGDGGPAHMANLNSPEGICVDASGNVFVADSRNDRIRMVDPNSTIVTIAGNGRDYYTFGEAQDFGSATQMHLNEPRDVTIDSRGDLYIADTGFRKIRKINYADYVRTFENSGDVSGWIVESDVEWGVENGTVAITGMSERVTRARIPEQLTGDFEISTRTEWVQGIDNNGYGVFFGQGEAGNYGFLISRHGSFLVYRWTAHDGYFYLFDWQRHQAIDASGENWLKVTAAAGHLEFKINGILVGEVSGENLYGDWAGLEIQGTQQILFDDLIVRGHSQRDPSALPEIQVAPGVLSFGVVAVGEESTLTISVRNTGGAALAVSGFTSVRGDFQIDAQPFFVGQGETVLVKVEFVPTNTGIQRTTISISSNDPLTPSYELFASGTGTASAIEITDRLNFGEVPFGRPSEKGLVIQNQGDADLVVRNLVYSSSEFRLVRAFSPIRPGGRDSLVIGFRPSQLGLRTATLNFTTNDPNNGSIQVALEATAFEAKPPTVTIDGVSPNPVVASGTVQVLFSGTATDNDQDGRSIERVRWVSSIDGELHSGGHSTEINFRIFATTLSVGSHDIGLQVWDNEGNSSAASSTLVVRGSPVNAFIDASKINSESVRKMLVREGLDEIYLHGSITTAVRVSNDNWVWSYRSEDDGFAKETQIGTGEEIEISPTFLSRGRHYIYFTVTDPASGQAGRDSIEVISRARFGRAIIVAGGDQALFTRYSARAANNVYRTLLSRRRFEAEDIVYLNPLRGWGVWWNDVRVTSTDVTVDRLHMEIAAATRDNVDLAVPLMVFLAGHGGVNTFQLADGEILEGEDLGSWLDALVDEKVQARDYQTAHDAPAEEIVVVVDFCFSRTFLETIAGPGRIVIGSSSEERAAVIGGTSFAEAFFQAVSKGGEGANIWRSFDEASTQVQAIFPQAPYIDVDGVSLVDERGNILSGQEGGVEIARHAFIGGEIGGQFITLGIEPEIYWATAKHIQDARYSIEAAGSPGLLGLNLSYAVVGRDGSLPGEGAFGTGTLDKVLPVVGDTLHYSREVTFPSVGETIVVIIGRDDLRNFAGQIDLAINVVLAGELSADFDGDGEVGFADFLNFAQAFGTTNATYDLDGDGVVGFGDFIILAAQFA